MRRMSRHLLAHLLEREERRARKRLRSAQSFSSSAPWVCSAGLLSFLAALGLTIIREAALWLMVLYKREHDMAPMTRA